MITREIGNIRKVNVFVSRVAVSLRIPGLKKKSLVKITSPVYNCHMVKVYTMDKLVRVLRNFGIVVSNPNRPSPVPKLYLLPAPYRG